MAKIHSVGSEHVVPLGAGWQLCPARPGGAEPPAGAEWLPARVPGTVAQALRDAGRWRLDAPAPLHGNDYWFRTRFQATGAQKLRFHGLATLTEVWLNGEKLLQSDNMFLSHEVAAHCRGDNELLICFRALQ